MKQLAATVISLSLLASASTQVNQAGAASGSGAPPTASVQDSQTITITRSGSQPSRKGPAENFTGSVRIDPLFQANDPSRTSGARVTFEPGARTAWHTHPLGQTLIVTAGSGWVQQWGGRIEEIRPGDVVWIPPGQKHWHGATATTGMTHIAIQEHLDGKVGEWNGRKYRQGRSCHRERGHRNWYHEGGAPMTTWTSDELNKIGTAEELELAPLRRNGTLQTPVTIWVVRLGDDLYVRSYRGRGGSWFRAAQVRHEGRIRAGGVEKDVTFAEKTDPGINHQIDAAYGAKYRRYGARFVNPMVAPEARAATIQLVPRSTSS